MRFRWGFLLQQRICTLQHRTLRSRQWRKEKRGKLQLFQILLLRRRWKTEEVMLLSTTDIQSSTTQQSFNQPQLYQRSISVKLCDTTCLWRPLSFLKFDSQSQSVKKNHNRSTVTTMPPNHGGLMIPGWYRMVNAGELIEYQHKNTV